MSNGEVVRKCLRSEELWRILKFASEEGGDWSDDCDEDSDYQKDVTEFWWLGGF